MQIVIELPKEYYEILKTISDETASMDMLIIKYGVPLPEHHGRLIDADKLPYEDIESIDGNTYMCVNAYDIDMAPTIIEGSESE